MSTQDIVINTVEHLKRSTEKKQFLIGFDGFVDEIIHVVSKRINDNKYERIETIADFSKRIAGCAGLSANIELVPEKIKLGGNGPIMANAILTQNNDVVYAGALGKYYIHPLFREFADKCKEVISLTEPGHTDALEFFDGKIMLGKMNNLTEVNWHNITKQKTESEMAGLFKDINLIAFTNWTMLSQMDTIIEGIDNVLKSTDAQAIAFFDLADPQKRLKKDIEKVLDLIKGLCCPTILSMNENESAIISDILGLNNEADILKRAKNIYESMHIEAIVIHPIKGAAIAHRSETIWMEGPYTSKPKLTTGAGDNFNAGFCNAWVRGLKPSECLTAGVCTSGFYVRNAYSPSTNELIKFMELWMENNFTEV